MPPPCPTPLPPPLPAPTFLSGGSGPSPWRCPPQSGPNGGPGPSRPSPAEARLGPARLQLAPPGLSQFVAPKQQKIRLPTPGASDPRARWCPRTRGHFEGAGLGRQGRVACWGVGAGTPGPPGTLGHGGVRASWILTGKTGSVGPCDQGGRGGRGGRQPYLPDPWLLCLLSQLCRRGSVCREAAITPGSGTSGRPSGPAHLPHRSPQPPAPPTRNLQSGAGVCGGVWGARGARTCLRASAPCLPHGSWSLLRPPPQVWGSWLVGGLSATGPTCHGHEDCGSGDQRLPGRPPTAGRGRGSQGVRAPGLRAWHTRSAGWAEGAQSVAGSPPAPHSPGARPRSVGLSLGCACGGSFLLFPQGQGAAAGAGSGRGLRPPSPLPPFPPVLTPSPPEQACVALETQAHASGSFTLNSTQRASRPLMSWDLPALSALWAAKQEARGFGAGGASSPLQGLSGTPRPVPSAGEGEGRAGGLCAVGKQGPAAGGAGLPGHGWARGPANMAELVARAGQPWRLASPLAPWPAPGLWKATGWHRAGDRPQRTTQGRGHGDSCPLQGHSGAIH